MRERFAERCAKGASETSARVSDGTCIFGRSPIGTLSDFGGDRPALSPRVHPLVERGRAGGRSEVADGTCLDSRITDRSG
ncbi:hypothetical protein C5C49_03400 [Rathayibacter sp. AY1E2]|nr:hypothetical protein C5C49_03400 [Rathayibacter sp. AY1E2]